MLEDYVRQALKRSGIKPSRSRGQHFLTDDDVLSRIIQAAKLTGDEIVLEIGPGLGQLTMALAPRCHQLYAYELDDQVVKYLTGWVIPDTRNVFLRDQAFNEYMLEEVIAEKNRQGRKLKIVTNLPYQISSAFLHTVVEYCEEIELVVVMLQKEVAQRVVALSGDPGYNSFSLYLKTFLDAHWVCDVPKGSFYPEPRVESAVISIKPLLEEERPKPKNGELYLKLVESVFRHQRKQLVNALNLAMSHLSREQVELALNNSGIDIKTRPQNLSMDDYVRLSDSIDGINQAAKDE